MLFVMVMVMVVEVEGRRVETDGNLDTMLRLLR